MLKEQTPHQEQNSSSTHPILTIFSLWQKRRWRLLFGIVIAVLALFCGLYLMEFSGLRLAGCVLGATLIVTALLRWVGIGRVVLRYGQRLFAHDAMFRALADLRVWFFKKLAHGSAVGLGFKRSGDMLSRLVSDIGALDGLYLRIIIPVICIIMALPVILMPVFSMNKYVGLAVSIVILCGTCFLPLLMAKISGKQCAQLTQQLALLRIKILDLVGGLREVCVFGAQTRMVDAIKAQDNLLFEGQKRQARYATIARIVSYLCGQSAIFIVLLAIVGVGLFHLPVLGGVAILFLLTALFDNFSNLTQAGAQAGMMGYAAKRVVDAAQTPAMTKKETPIIDLPKQCDIALEDVSFRWSDDRPWVLRHCQFHLSQGEHVAIVGESGAGKSTIAALMLDVVSPQQGEVDFGGNSYLHLNSAKIRQKIAWLSQNTHIFADTIRSNLLLADPNANDERLWEVLREASIDDFVKSLPQGLDSWLGENGINISGGQGRRIALARTLLMDAPIIILDEPTSGLDMETAKGFLQTLNDVLENKSVLYITHQFYGVEKLDRTMCLQEGQLKNFDLNSKA